MAFARFVKKIVSPVAILATSLLAFTGITPANAAAPAAENNIGTVQVTSDWAVGSASTITLPDASGVNWHAQYESRTTAWQGKVLSLTGSITPAVANGSASVSAAISYYKADGSSSATYGYGNINASSNVNNDYQATVPADAARVQISFYASFNNSGSSSGDLAFPLGTAYTPTFTLKLDGAAQTINNSWTGTNSQASDDVHLTQKPSFTQLAKASSFPGNASYISSYQETFACVDTSTLNTGDTLQIHHFVDGVDMYSNVNYYDNYNNVRSSDVSTNGSGSDWVNSKTTTLTQTQKTNGGQLMFNASNDRYIQTLQSGTNSFAMSIQNSAGEELNVPCALSPLSNNIVPTLTVGGSSLVVSVTDPSFANSPYKWAVYRASDDTLLGSGTGSGNGTRTLSVCGLNGCTSVAPTGVPVYVKVARTFQFYYFGNSSLSISTPWSTKSANATLPDPWVSVSPAVSGGNAPGDASVISSNINYAAAAQDPSLMLPTSPRASDGNNGTFTTVQSAEVSQLSPSITMKLFRLGATGIDTTFGGAGATGVTLATNLGPNASAQTAWYGSRNKWVSVVRDTVFGQTPVTNYRIVQGNYSSVSTITPILKSASELTTFCGTVVTGSTATILAPMSAPTSDPIFTMSCLKSVSVNGSNVSNTTTLIVKIAANGTVTTVAQLNTGDGVTESFWTAFANIANVNASAASDVALTLVGFTSKFVSPTQYDIVTRKGIQIKVDGSVTNVSNPYTSSATTSQTEKSYVFSRTALGASTTGFLRTLANGVTTYKWATLGSNGVITEGDNVVFDTVAGFNTTVNGVTSDTSLLSFVDGQEVGTGGKIQLRRFLGSTKVAAVTVDLDAKTLDTGEVVTYQTSLDQRVIQLYFVDDQGRLNWMFTSANQVLSLIRWNGVNGSGGSLPAGVTVTDVSTKFITNGASVVTLTGTGLKGITGRLTVGGVLVTPTSNTGTKLVFTITTGTVAGAIDIVAPFAGGAATLGSVTRVGATKQAQTIVDTADVSSTWAGSAVTATFPAASSVDLPTTIKVAPASLCSVSGSTVSVNGSGVCTVTVSQAGDLGTNAAAAQTTKITVAARTQNVTALLTAIAGANRAWNGSTSTITLPAATSSVGLAVAIAVTPAAVCTNVANVITVKSAGACVVSLTTSKDNGTPALAKATATVTIAKGNLELLAEADFTVSDSAADSNNVANVGAEVTPSAENLVDYAYTSSNEDVCTVDDDGNVTGVLAGSCVITIAADAGPNWTAATDTVNVTVQASVAVPADVLPEVGDGNVSPKAIVSNKSAFVSTNDKSFLVRWDKAAGLLTFQSTGIYTGWIKTETTFTVGGTSYTCVNVFGTTAALKGATAAQRKLALKSKVFTAGSAVCKDASKVNVPASIGAPADFAKIAKAAKTAQEKAAEAAGFTKLKNFSGNVTIKVTRYRAWPTTMRNVTSAGKKIPATVRTTVVALQ